MSSLLYRICRLSKKTFCLVRPSSEFFTFAFFLVLSGLIWLAVSLNEYYEREVEIPVHITDVPNTIAISEGTEDAIRVTLRDKGFSFIYYIYGERLEPIKVSFPAYKRKNGTLVVNSVELKKLIHRVLETTTVVTAVKPEKLEYTYAQCVSKTVPVRLAGKIEPAEAYYLAQSQIEPERVTIYLSKSLADSVDHVTTEHLNISNLSDTMNLVVRLQPMRGVKFTRDKVAVHLLADILTEAEIDVPVTAVNVPDDMLLRFFPSRVKVRYVVGLSLMKSIDTSGFVVEADYKNLTGDVDKCPIRLVQMPHGVVKGTLLTDQVDYLKEY